MEDIFYKLLLLRSPGVGPVKYSELIRRFGNAQTAVEFLMPKPELKDSVRKEMDLAYKLNIKYLSDDDVNYPCELKSIKNHPPILTVRGNVSVFGKPSVSIVGTRHATGAGLRLVSEIANAFASNGHVVVSGMAMGTDTAAHNGALRAPGDAQTIAVLAGGVDYIWPLENERLYNNIIERGAVISEMPVGFSPMGGNFVQRNRWIAGLSQKLILGEADLKSGSMATARFAYDYKKQVFAIPSHPSDPRSVGPNSLIKDNLATICMGKNDFFSETKCVCDKKSILKNKKIDDENSLLDRLGIIPQSESVLADMLKKSIAEIKGELVVLELMGMARKQDGGYVRI